MDMRNNITFTGITNLYTGEKIYSKFGSYVTNGDIKQGEKNYKELLIRCKLTDDSTEKDYTEFWNALGNSRNSYQARCVMQNSKDEIVLNIKRCEVEDDVLDISNSNFTLNGIAIEPNDREVLPLFTYLAKFTRKLAAQPENSPEKKELFNLANKSIHEEAVKFIDNMY